jgi:hypothetical protein
MKGVLLGMLLFISNRRNRIKKAFDRLSVKRDLLHSRMNDRIRGFKAGDKK